MAAPRKGDHRPSPSRPRRRRETASFPAAPVLRSPPGGRLLLLQQLTKRVLESVLEGEITDHLGYEKHDAAGKKGGNSHHGKRSKTVLTDMDPVTAGPRSTATGRSSIFFPTTL